MWKVLVPDQDGHWLVDLETQSATEASARVKALEKQGFRVRILGGRATMPAPLNPKRRR